MTSELAVVNSGELYRQATDVAGLCRDIVLKKAVEIQGRRYVPVEPWMAIAVAHGCIAGIQRVERVEGEGDMVGGFKAIAELRRQSDGVTLATAEGFVGEDEPVWYGGIGEVWDKKTRKRVKKTYEKRPDYAIRAMASTRAISRVCRSAFAHVVVLIDAQLDTTPAEEIPSDEDHHGEKTVTPAETTDQKATPSAPEARWQAVECTFGKTGGPLRGKLLGELTPANLRFLHGKFSTMSPSEISEKDRPMVAALAQWEAEQT